MNNEKIITEIAKSVYGEEAVKKMLESGIEIPLHTLKGWSLRGPYKIKKGAHGIETRLWKRKKRKKDIDIPEEDGSEESGNFVLVKSYLFREDQIERTDN